MTCNSLGFISYHVHVHLKGNKKGVKVQHQLTYHFFVQYSIPVHDFKKQGIVTTLTFFWITNGGMFTPKAGHDFARCALAFSFSRCGASAPLRAFFARLADTMGARQHELTAQEATTGGLPGHGNTKK